MSDCRIVFGGTGIPRDDGGSSDFGTSLRFLTQRTAPQLQGAAPPAFKRSCSHLRQKKVRREQVYFNRFWSGKARVCKCFAGK